MIRFVCRFIFLLQSFIVAVCISAFKQCVYIFDKCTSTLLPYICKKPDYEFVPNHLLLTGALLSTTHRE